MVNLISGGGHNINQFTRHYNHLAHSYPLKEAQDVVLLQGGGLYGVFGGIGSYRHFSPHFAVYLDHNLDAVAG